MHINNRINGNYDVANMNVEMEKPLITVVIPCFNQGQFLGEAIESILSQSYKKLEIIVVNDGSTDTTSDVARKYKEVILIEQENKGLAATRNIGLSFSRGEYIVFLDADDLLLPNAVETNVKYLLRNKNAVFVSGRSRYIAFDGTIIEDSKIHKVSSNHYENLLSNNYIGHPAVVMYKKDTLLLLGGFKSNPKVRAVEDYDLHLSLSRNHEVLNHQEVIACYRRYNSMSGNCPLMLKNVLAVQKAQLPYIKDKPVLLEAQKKGIKRTKLYYTRKFISGVRGKDKKWKETDINEKLFMARQLPVFFGACIKQKYGFIKSRHIKPQVLRLLPNMIIKRISRQKVEEARDIANWL